MKRELTDTESREAMSQAIDHAIEEVKALAEAEIKLNATTPTGACCLYTFGVSACTESITKSACRTAANETGTMWKWFKGKKCSEIKCP